MYKLGIDVGGTNTDAVLIDEDPNVVAAVKNPTSDDIYTGIMGAVDAVLADGGVDRAQIAPAMLAAQLAVRFASAVVFSGVIAKLACDGLARTGVLRSYAVGARLAPVSIDDEEE